MSEERKTWFAEGFWMWEGPNGERSRHPADDLNAVVMNALVTEQAARRAAEGKRDEFQRKYHEAMDVLTTWGNIDSAEAVARMIAAEAEVTRLAGAVEEAANVARGLPKLIALARATNLPDADIITKITEALDAHAAELAAALRPADATEGR